MKIPGRQIPEVMLVLYGLAASLVWELAHSALYVDHGRGMAYVLWTRFHCSVGDVMILLGAFWWTSLLFRSRNWFAKNSRLPAAVFVLSGLTYTLWSEWYNTQVARTWDYSSAMPTIYGIGLSPLAQWLIIPMLLVFVAGRNPRCPADKEQNSLSKL